MQLTRFTNMALRYMEEFGLDDWDFDFTNHLTKFGWCDYNRNTIYVSVPLVELNNVAACKDTILHEIAHVLAGWRAAPHGPRWQRIAAEIGAIPEDVHESGVYNMPYRWDVTCLECQLSWQYMRKVNTACSTCGGSVKWEPTIYHLSAKKAG